MFQRKHYHLVKQKIHQCERVYQGFHVSFDNMLVLESEDSYTNCYDLSLATIVQLIEKRFRFICQDDIDNIDGCYSNLIFKRGHVDSRIFKRDQEDECLKKTNFGGLHTSNVNVRKKMVYMNKVEKAERKIFKDYSKYIPKTLNNIIFLLLETKSVCGIISLQSLLNTIDIFFTSETINNILIDIQSPYLSSNIKSMSSRYRNSHPCNTFANCFNSFPVKASTSFRTNSLHQIFVEHFPLDRSFCTDYYEITNMRSITQLWKHQASHESHENTLNTDDHPVQKKEELQLYQYFYQYFCQLVEDKPPTNASIMSMYTDVFQTKFEYYFRLNFKRKLQLYDVSLDLVKNLLNGEHDRDFYKDDNDMIIEYDHNHDIIEDEIKKVYRLMEKRHKNANCSTNEESFVLERIDLSYQLFKIFFSSLEYSSDIGSTSA